MMKNPHRMIKTTVLFFFLSCSIFTMFIASAQESIVSTVADQREISLSVYNNNVALLRELRTVTLMPGEISLKIVGIPKTIDPLSVLMQVHGKNEDVLIKEFSYRQGLLNQRRLLEKYIGKEIILAQRVEDSRTEKQYRAVLLSTDGGNVYKIGDQIHIGHPGRIILPDIPEELVVADELNASLLCDEQGQYPLEISYMMHGVQWSCDYRAIVNQDKNVLTLTGMIALTNNAGVNFHNAAIMLVAGEPQIQHAAPVKRKMIMAQAAAPAEKRSAQVSRSALFEYHLYTLQGKKNVDDGETKFITLLKAQGIFFEKKYIFEPHRQFTWHRYNEPFQTNVDVQFTLSNDKKHNLGVPLPAGRVRIYSMDSNGFIQFLGEDNISHTPIGENIRLTAGKSFDIVGMRKQTRFKRIDKNTTEQSIEILLKNHKRKDVLVSIREHPEGEWNITHFSNKWKKKDSRTIEFSVMVPKEGEKKLTYTVRSKK